MNTTDDFSTICYPLNEWEQCFATWHKNLTVYPGQLQLVLSTHPYNEGYWIEPIGTQVRSHTDFIYLGDEVLALEKRVRAGIEKHKKLKSMAKPLIL